MKKYVIAMVSIIFLFSGCALQKDVYRMEDRVEALERRNVDLEKKNKALREEAKQAFDKNLAKKDSRDQKLRAQYAGLSATFDQFRDDINQLSGRIDESEYMMKQDFQSMQESQQANAEQMMDMRKQLDEATKRLAQLEAYLNLEKKAAASTTTTAVADSPKKTEGKSENDLYAEAKQAFDAADFDTARNGFAELITKFPKSANADNAQFWIGETYYKEKWYEKAILEYQKVLDNFPKGNKVPAALLKQGMAFMKLGDKTSSRQIFKELANKFPQTSEGKIATQKLTEIK